MHPQPKSIAEVGKLFDERFAHEQWPDLIKTGQKKDEIKQFWLEHYRSLLEGVRKDDKTFPERESDDFDAGYSQRNQEINTAIQTLLGEEKESCEHYRCPDEQNCLGEEVK